MGPQMQNFLESAEFGNDAAGYWYLMLFPYGDNPRSSLDHNLPANETPGDLIVKVVSHNKQSLTARASFSLLDAEDNTIDCPLIQGFEGFKWFQTTLYYNSVTLCQDEDMDELLDEYCHNDILRLRCQVQVVRRISSDFSETLSRREDIAATSLSNELLNFSKSLSPAPTNKRYSTGRQYTAAYKHGAHYLPSSISTEMKNSGDIVTIIVTDEDNARNDPIIAYKFVLASRSKVFRAMLYGGFREGQSPSLSLP